MSDVLGDCTSFGRVASILRVSEDIPDQRLNAPFLGAFDSEKSV